MLHAKLNLSHGVDVVHAGVLLLEILVDDGRGSQEEHCRLRLDKVLNQDGAVDELEEDEATVHQAARALVRQKLFLGQWHHGEGEREEDGEDLEGDEFGERFVDVASVAKAHSEVFDWEP